MQLLNHTAFLQQLCISLFLLPLLPFFILMFFVFLVITPFLCSFMSACLVFKVVSLELKFVACLGATVRATKASQIARRSKNDDEMHVIQQEGSTAVLDTWNLPSPSQCEEQEGDFRGFLVQEYSDTEEYKSFYEILSFWRKMEQGDIRIN